MSELKAMGLVGVGAFVVYAALSVGLLMLGGGGGSLIVAMGFVGVLTSIAMSKLIQHYVARDERRAREATLRLR